MASPIDSQTVGFLIRTMHRQIVSVRGLDFLVNQNRFCQFSAAVQVPVWDFYLCGSVGLVLALMSLPKTVFENLNSERYGIFFAFFACCV